MKSKHYLENIREQKYEMLEYFGKTEDDHESILKYSLNIVNLMLAGCQIRQP